MGPADGLVAGTETVWAYLKVVLEGAVQVLSKKRILLLTKLIQWYI